ncbi:tetratricopeptide repeat protein [Neobacillus notoginsengisoli]|uniref:Tetratricopeptide repeat protein n=1 Tax=Neobacillus notoginsengisoli TaxID=1578198 RepID=A0A417YSF5_9BACI|nr:tetratricopeptide repeat protein [Neobacillus notoginsengisoli]RHW38921.1 tetratricopeptide repeat protein [Neobacillus notoginsengisoli]
MGKDSKAMKNKGKLLSFFPTGEHYFAKGLKAYHRRDFEKANKYLQRAFQLEPGEPMIACQLALVNTEIGEYENSNVLLHLILDEMDPDMTECHYFLANNYAHLGMFKEAARYSRRYLELEEDGEFAEDAEDLLELLYLEGVDEEDELFEEDDLMLKQEEARGLLEAGHFLKAIEMLEVIVEEYPEYWSAYNNLALAHFYLGHPERAHGVLADVLERNPGNLHALCNLLVFAHYRKDREEIDRLIGVLSKVKPLLVEHQFKLGASFALAGEYKLAFDWLKKLYKSGYEGDGPFYYWFSYAAYHIGKEDLAQSLWQKVIAISPDKEGAEPWGENAAEAGLEDLPQTILQKLDSVHSEERLFGIFLISVSPSREELLASAEDSRSNGLTAVEREYLAYLKTGSHSSIADAHQTAETLYGSAYPISEDEAGLYQLWFTIYGEARAKGLSLKNHHAWAAAVEYIWLKCENEKTSMQELAGRYDLSAATVRKYVKMAESCLE